MKSDIIDTINYINGQFVTRKQAEELRKVGFKQPCLGFFSDINVNNDNVLLVNAKPIRNYDRRKKLTAPMYQQAFSFLLEVLGKMDKCLAIYSLDLCNDGSGDLLRTNKFVKSFETYEECVDVMLNHLKGLKKEK